MELWVQVYIHGDPASARLYNRGWTTTSDPEDALREGWKALKSLIDAGTVTLYDVPTTFPDFPGVVEILISRSDHYGKPWIFNVGLFEECKFY